MNLVGLCETCEYYKPYDKSLYGQCRRFPPTPLLFPVRDDEPAFEAHYPEVTGEKDGCGEHRRIAVRQS
jgi:hypothetical protein